MPTYDYQCPKCGLEEIHNVAYDERDVIQLTCPSCEEDEEILVRRITCHGIRPEAIRHSPKEKGMVKDILEYHRIEREGWKKESVESLDQKIKRNNEVVKLKYTKR